MIKQIKRNYVTMEEILSNTKNVTSTTTSKPIRNIFFLSFLYLFSVNKAFIIYTLSVYFDRLSVYS